MNVSQRLYESLKAMTTLLNREGSGHEVSDTEWGHCQAMCQLAQNDYEASQRTPAVPVPEVKDESKGKQRASSRGFASSRTVSPK